MMWSMRVLVAVTQLAFGVVEAAEPARDMARQAPVAGAAASASASASRDEEGRVIVHAIALKAPLRLDGRLDEEVYRTVPSVGDFVQQVPREGAPATERTETWVMFDGAN